MNQVNPTRGRSRREWSWLLASALATQLACLPAHATLGEDVASVENDRIKLKATVRTTSVAGYTVHEIQSETSTKIREYIAPSGKVFAVAWDGPLLPDMQQTLGKYFPEYSDAQSGGHRVGNRSLSVQGTDLVVKSFGHMRAFHGIAYVPSLLPTNFSAADIK